MRYSSLICVSCICVIGLSNCFDLRNGISVVDFIEKLLSVWEGLSCCCSIMSMLMN